ncbi:MAG: PdaC/SigV domain-containing protein [Peptostreptococcaceae bacterium]
MKRKNTLLKTIVSFVIGILVIVSIKSNDIFEIKDRIRANISQSIKVIKVTEEKAIIHDKKIEINAKIPKIYYENKEVERYINSYIRKCINEYINHQRQLSEVNENDNNKKIIDINYHVVYEDDNLINMIIYKNIRWNKKDFELEKDSYIFDLKTGQRIYIDNFLKYNEDYEEVIEKYIYKNIKEKDISKYKDKIVIDKNTNYYIGDDGINIYFNPYKESKNSKQCEFKIPYDIFKSKISMIRSDNIVANVETQTINEKNKYINSVINIPIIMTEDKKIEKDINDKMRNDIMDFYAKAKEEAIQYSKEFKGESFNFVANTDFEVKKNSNNMLSIVVTYYKYSGGAHGEYNNVAYNIYMKTGEILTLESMFNLNADYIGVINNEVRCQIEELVKNDKENKEIYQFTTISENQKFYIQDDNIVIYFDLYDIAPYAAGIPEFRVNIAKISHILKQEYIEIFK